ncbi:MAG: hypothetical protein JMDDDDMK_04650 [Acidobacteria bacterium]|nr:hypothetical protein [Acidobacteriota bacterium]
MSNVAEDTLDELEKDLSSSPGSGRAEGAPPVASEEGGEDPPPAGGNSGDRGGEK